MTKVKPDKKPKVWLVILAVCSFLLTFLLPTASWLSYPANSLVSNFGQTQARSNQTLVLVVSANLLGGVAKIKRRNSMLLCTVLKVLETETLPLQMY